MAPWVALAHLDLALFLILHDEAVESRVIWRRRRRPYSALAGFRIETHGIRSAVILMSSGSLFTFVGVLSDPNTRAADIDAHAEPGQVVVEHDDVELTMRYLERRD